MSSQTKEIPSEREGTRIRAFLAKVKPLNGCDFGEQDEYWEGRALIEQLAVAYDLETEDYRWDALECSTVVRFLSWIEPVKGTCFCHDQIEKLGVSTTCGFHAILEFASDEMRRIGSARRAKREVAHG
jgi:hypothetical protein